MVLSLSLRCRSGFLLERYYLRFGGVDKAAFQLADKAFSGKKGYLYFTPTLKVAAARTLGRRRLAMNGDSGF